MAKREKMDVKLNELCSLFQASTRSCSRSHGRQGGFGRCFDVLLGRILPDGGYQLSTVLKFMLTVCCQVYMIARKPRWELVNVL